MNPIYFSSSYAAQPVESTKGGKALGIILALLGVFVFIVENEINHLLTQ